MFLTSAINTTDAISFGLVTASGTTYQTGTGGRAGVDGAGLNPAFTVIEFDEEYMVPLNVHTYYMNLTEANANPDNEPVWRELHDFLNEYQLEDLSPT